MFGDITTIGTPETVKNRLLSKEKNEKKEEKKKKPREQ
jgi:hypothetical protein